jgi:heme A synthase
MSDTTVFLALTAAALGFVSVLIYINLRSQGIAPARVRRLLIELWGGFALIVAIFFYIAHILGDVVAGSPAEELARRLSRWGALTSGQQIIIVVGSFLALVLFLHVIWSLNSVQRKARRHLPPSDGGTIS